MKLARKNYCRSKHGISLIQCLVYISLLGVMISVGGYTVAKALDQHRALAHNVNDIQKAVSIGEHWRSDIRAATGRIISTRDGSNQMLTIPTRAGEVVYEIRDCELRRRASPAASWVPLHDAVRGSQMESFSQAGVTAWRWDLELKSSAKKARVRPEFTFTAVPGKEATP